MLVVISNTKIGKALHVNLPLGAPRGLRFNAFTSGTCPGASSWCLENCYGIDRPPSEDPEALEALKRTIELSLRDLKAFKTAIIGELLSKARILEESRDTLEDGSIPVRLHVVGDFYHPDYARAWLDIVDELKGLKFRSWTYTKSWWTEKVAETYAKIELANPQAIAEELLDVLQELRKRENFKLYASTDRTMPDITRRPEMRGWLEAGIEFTYNEKPITCPEIPCVVCGHCIYGRGHVKFMERRSKIRPIPKP
ncbi:MAG: GP88 family protein, partial [Acidilobaceae archaeon]